MECIIANILEAFVADDALEGGAPAERTRFDIFEHIGKSDTREGGAASECMLANSFEVFVEDDAFEGGASVERMLFDDFEVIGEGDTHEGVAVTEGLHSNIRNDAVLTEYQTHEMATAINENSGMLSSLGHPERSTRRRE